MWTGWLSSGSLSGTEMQHDIFSVFSVICILLVVRSICQRHISQFSLEASRRTKLVIVERFWGFLVTSISTIMLHLMLVLFQIQSEFIWHLVHHGKWWREEVNSLPLKVKPGNTWYKCCEESMCKIMWDSNKKCCIFLITSQESYIFLSLINRILAVVKSFARMKIRGLLFLKVFSIHTLWDRVVHECLKSAVCILSAEDSCHCVADEMLSLAYKSDGEGEKESQCNKAETMSINLILKWQADGAFGYSCQWGRAKH